MTLEIITARDINRVMGILITSVNDAIAALGGDNAAVALVGHRSPSAAANWRARGRIPAVHYPIVQAELAKHGKTAAPVVFGMRNASEAAQ